MEKTFTVKELLAIAPALGALGNAPFKANFKLSRRIAKILKTVDDEIKEYNETREKMLKDKYAELDGSGQPVVVDSNYRVKKDLQAEFHGEVEALLAEPFALAFDAVTWDEIEAALKEPLPPAVLSDLEWLFV